MIVPAPALLTLECSSSMPTLFHCMGTNSIELEFGVGLGDQLYSQLIFEPGFVKGNTGSVLSTGQQRPRLDGAIIWLSLQICEVRRCLLQIRKVLASGMATPPRYVCLGFMCFNAIRAP